MLLPTVNYLRVLDYKHNATYRNKSYIIEKSNKVARGNLRRSISIYQSIDINLEKWQIALALIPSLEVHGAIEW